jgi:hypothetical protein
MPTAVLPGVAQSIAAKAPYSQTKGSEEQRMRYKWGSGDFSANRSFS